MTDPLPRPTITSSGSYDNGKHKVDVTVARDGKSRVYTGTGSSVEAVGRDLVEKVLDDYHSAEYVKRG